MSSRETKQYNAGSVPRTPDLILFGGALKKLKGLWFLGSGLLLLVVWEYLFWNVYFDMLSRGATADNPFQIFLLSLAVAGYSLFHPVLVFTILPATMFTEYRTVQIFDIFQLVSTILPATMFTLIAIGLFRLIRSLLRHWRGR